MEKEGLIVLSENDGRRKTYLLTNAGMEALRAEYSRLRAMVRDDFDDISAEPHPVVAVLQNIALLFALLLLLGVTAAMSTVATTARGLIRDTLDLPDGALTGWLLSLVPIAGTLLAGFLLFAFIYRATLNYPSR